MATDVVVVVMDHVRLDRVIRFPEAVDVLSQFRWTELRQIRKEPVRVDDDTAMYEKPETYQ